MKVIVTEGKRDFTLVADVESILNEIEEMKQHYKSEFYVEYGTSPDFFDEDFKYIDENTYIENVEKFKNAVNDIISNDNRLALVISNFPRKKDGTFNRRFTDRLHACENCVDIHEWHNTWIYKELKVYASTNTKLVVTLWDKADTPA